MANGLVLVNGAWTLQYATPIPTGFIRDTYGSGGDGDVVVTGTYTLTKETHFNSLSITGSGVVKPAGYRIFVKNTLTINSGCSINDDGNSGNNNTAGASLAARGYLGAYTTVGGGGSGGNTNGSIGGSNVYDSTYNDSGILPNGGAGGNCGIRTGGAVGPITAAALRIFSDPFSGRNWGPAAATNEFFAGGGSGGGGASATVTALGGGGGSGAGIVWLAAKTINNNGRISANGGNGGNASGTAGTSGSSGGGGGGGGIVVIFTNTPVSSCGIVMINGGIGGLGIGPSGTTGSSGISGSLCFMSTGGN